MSPKSTEEVGSIPTGKVNTHMKSGQTSVFPIE
jgi:hypothetical protein